METIKRNYNIKDVDFLITADTIINSAIANQPFLETKRSNWKPAFFDDIKTQIDNAIKTFLGVDSAKKLRDASQTVYAIVKPANAILAEVKVQIEEDFKDTPTQKNEMLNNLGYTSYFAASRRGDQEGLINLLYQFKTNLTTELATSIVNKGTAQASLDKIINYADQLKDANVMQEGAKGTRQEITAEAITEFNNIYDKIISIAKITSKFYKKQQTSSKPIQLHQSLKKLK